MTLWEVWTGAEMPYWAVHSDEEVAQRVAAGQLQLVRPDECSDAVWGVMQKCWAPVARERPAFLSLKEQLQDALGEATARAARESCVCCLERAPVIALRPCGHKCVCAECFGALRECPICRAPIEGSLRVFD